MKPKLSDLWRWNGTLDRGTYLFVDVTIKTAGRHPLKIVAADGSATAPFEALPPLPRVGRFQGFSQDDLI